MLQADDEVYFVAKGGVFKVNEAVPVVLARQTHSQGDKSLNYRLYPRGKFAGALLQGIIWSYSMDSADAGFEQITVYLKRLSAGDQSAETPLAEAVYNQMRSAARGIVGDPSGKLTLQATGLVNMVLIELLRLRSVDWKDREHFFRTASRMLRRRFIDYIRARRAAKRPTSAERVDIEACLLPTDACFDEILDVHRGLDELAEFDPDLAELVELVYFGGCPIATAAEIRGVSPKTIGRHLDLAEKWLRARFSCPVSLARYASIGE
jgi:RNA polymerase sigma factor (TIGR02999 family)